MQQSGAVTVWAGAADAGAKLDLAELSELFTAEREASSSASARRGTRGKTWGNAAHADPPRVVLGSKRSMNMAIALSRIQLPAQEVRLALMSFDSAALTLEQVCSLRDCMPAEGDEALLRCAGLLSSSNGMEHQEQQQQLGEAEKFLLEMVRHAPSVVHRRTCCEYVLRFEPRPAEQRRATEALRVAVHEVRHSVKLKHVLGVVLRIGNELNDKQTSAFTLDSLLKLPQTKAFDGRTTVLDFVLKVVVKQGTAVEFGAEIASVSAAARCPSLQAQQTELTEQAGLQMVGTERAALKLEQQSAATMAAQERLDAFVVQAPPHPFHTSPPRDAQMSRFWRIIIHTHIYMLFFSGCSVFSRPLIPHALFNH